MKFFAVAALAAGALAAPAELMARTYTNAQICPNGLYSNLVCADVDVLGILCLNAVSRTCHCSTVHLPQLES